MHILLSLFHRDLDVVLNDAAKQVTLSASRAVVVLAGSISTG